MVWRIGVDEVGRGALAGDLVVVAAAFRRDASGEAARRVAKDSKAFSGRRQREQAWSLLEDGCVWVLARRSPEDIERLNIRGAVLSAFSEAAERLAASMAGAEPVEVLWDGKDRAPFVWHVPGSVDRAVVKGDATVPEIAAASMIAKVRRDRDMEAAARVWPHYGWEKNAGYGTPAHQAGLAGHGMSPLHRTWARKFVPGLDGAG